MTTQMPKQRTIVVGMVGSFVSFLFIIRTIGNSDIFGYYNNLVLSKYMVSMWSKNIIKEQMILYGNIG